MMPLPLELLRKRLEKEMDICRTINGITVTPSVVATASFPVILTVSLEGPVGLLVDGDGTVRQTNTHSFEVTIHRDYPIRKPSVRWLTPIFHPNISPAEEKGIVCTRILLDWRADRTLYSLISGIAHLIENPNIGEPLGFDICRRAVSYMTQGAAYEHKNSGE